MGTAGRLCGFNLLAGSGSGYMNAGGPRLTVPLLSVRPVLAPRPHCGGPTTIEADLVGAVVGPRGVDGRPGLDGEDRRTSEGSAGTLPPLRS